MDPFHKELPGLLLKPLNHCTLGFHLNQIHDLLSTFLRGPNTWKSHSDWLQPNEDQTSCNNGPSLKHTKMLHLSGGMKFLEGSTIVLCVLMVVSGSLNASTDRQIWSAKDVKAAAAQWSSSSPTASALTGCLSLCQRGIFL